MKKLSIILLALAAIIFSACEGFERPTPVSDIKEVSENIKYFRSGNLCFAAVASKVRDYKVISITCVPCDSLTFKQEGTTYDWR